MSNKVIDSKDVPDAFYKALTFKAEIKERDDLLVQLQLDLQRRFKEAFKEDMVTVVKAPDKTVDNFIFITHPDVLISAATSGVVESNLYMRSYNYTKILYKDFHEQFALNKHLKQIGLFEL